MSTTPNLLIQHVASNQASKEVTLNAGLDDLDAAMTAQLITDLMSTTFDQTLPVPSALYNLKLKFTGTPAAININLPAYAHHYIVENATGSTSPLTPGNNLTFRVMGGGRTVVVPPLAGKFVELYCDSYHVDRMGPDVAFEHDGSANSSQYLLNLKSGANINVVDLGSGNIQLNSTAIPGSNILVGSTEASYIADWRDKTIFAHIRGKSMLHACNGFNAHINYSTQEPGSGIAPVDVTIERIVVYKFPHMDPRGNMFAPYTLSAVATHASWGTLYTGVNLAYLLPGTTVLVAGFSNSANNGLKFVLNSTPTSVTVVAGLEVGESAAATMQVTIIANEGGIGTILTSSRGGTTDIAANIGVPLDPAFDYIVAAIATTANNPTNAVAAAVGDTFANDGNTLKGAIYSGDATLLVGGQVLPPFDLISSSPLVSSYGPGILFMQFQVVS